MDEDEYNALTSADLFGDTDSLAYSDGEDPVVPPVCVINELNAVDRRPEKRPLDLTNSDAIDWHMRVPCSFEEANEMREKELASERILNHLAERILQARKRKRLMDNAEGSVEVEGMAETDGVAGCVLLSPPIDGTPWVGVSAPDMGQRYYVRLRKTATNNAVGYGCKRAEWNRLNSRPIHEVLDKAREQLQTHTEGQSVMDVEENSLDATIPLHTQLWVDKYAPRTYVDLISDDRVNRLLLKWLKMWDECVFKRTVSDVLLGSVEERDNVITLDSGKPKRPQQKVVLISGAAGLGKTTLAGVAARHCGYGVVEMNASDDRNVGDFERKIEGAVRAVRTLDKDSRPNCLVVDEIDGAPADAIKYLCKTLQATGRKSIRRPIVCICNNLYVPSLRELRSIALVLQMPCTQQHHLEHRLQQIANTEHVRIDLAALAAMVDICACDLRSSINALQFLSVQSHSSNIDLETVKKYGERESHLGERSLFDVWSAVLETRGHADSKGRLLDVSARISRITALSQRFFTESDRFHMGLFANYLTTACPSLRISSFSTAANTFCEYDELSRLVLRSQNYSLMRYVFVLSVQLHLLLASKQRLQLSFPSLDQNAVQQRRQSVETVLSVRAGSMQRGIPERVLTLDLLPMLVIIVQPPLKPMNTQLYSARELGEMKAVVGVMRSYALTYTAALQEGVTSFVFCPPVDVLVMFPVEESERRRATFLTNALRQMIAHRIDLARLRNDDEQVEKENERGGAAAKSTRNWMRELGERNGHDSLLDEGSGIVYRYNQGFSNAIRRNIRMRNLVF